MSIPSTVKTFGLLCEQVTNEPSLIIKEEIIRGFVSRFSGDLAVLMRLLLPKYANRIYYAQEKQLLRVLSVVLSVPEETLKAEWNQNGCVAETARNHFTPTAPLDGSGVCRMDLDTFDHHLDRMAEASTETMRIAVVSDFFKHACPRAVYLFFREIKLDMRLGAGLRVVLNGLHPNAYQIFQHTANIAQVVEQIKKAKVTVKTNSTGQVTDRGAVTAQIQVGVPLAPMLAAPSKSIDYVLSKCPNGAFSEVKYDGERMQIHKQGGKLSFFARSLKPMQPAKYAGLENYIRQAIQADTCILDGEILLVDLKTSIPLPFGTLGSHKRTQFTQACPCVFLFDMLYKDGESLLDTPLEERREAMKSSVQFIRNRVMFSELCLVQGDAVQRRVILQKHLNRAIAEGLEGLVIKDIKGTYEPRARHWVKLKKDYLDGLADSADLLVLGAWYGSGNKGGQLSVFLMGCVDTSIPEGLPGRYKTVCKVGNGLKDSAITILSQKYSKTMEPVRQGRAPSWLSCHNSHMPDVVLRDVKAADVMEIIGAEFSVTKTHTSGVSIRFPRILRVRSDKTTDTATTCQELLELFRASKEKAFSAGVSDSLELIDNYAILDDPEESNPPVAGAKETSPQPSPSAVEPSMTAAPLQPFSYIQGADATDPPVSASENVLLAHTVAVGGQWSARGFMGQITRKFGPVAQRAYDQGAEDRHLGEVVLAEVGPASRAGRVHIASLLAQEPSVAAGHVPKMNDEALEKCLGLCVRYCSTNNASLHLVKPPPATEVDWSRVETFLKKESSAAAVNVLVYGADPHVNDTNATEAKVTTVSSDHTNTSSSKAASKKRERDEREQEELQEGEGEGEKLKKRKGESPSTIGAKETTPFQHQPGAPLLQSLRAQLVMPYGAHAIDIAELIGLHGGEVVSVSPQYSTNLRSNLIIVEPSPDTQAALVALQQMQTPVVTDQWVEDSVRYGTAMDYALYHLARQAILKGYTLLLAEEDEGEWARAARLMGAQVWRDWPAVAEHTEVEVLLLASSWTPLVDRRLSQPEALKRSLTVVHTRWLTDSAIAQTALPTHNYTLHRKSIRQSLVEEDDLSDCSTDTYVDEK